MKIFTIGFKGKSAKKFFTTLKTQGIQKLIDVRRKNASQLAGYTKGSDLKFFCEECFQIAYEHIPDFGPSEELLKEYKTRLGKKKQDDAAWRLYVERFEDEVLSGNLIPSFDRAVEGFESVCFLCSEETAERCHRRLLAEHFKKHVPGVEVLHI